MLWVQKLVIYTDHKNLMQDTLGLTCDRIYHWRLLLEEYGHEIVYRKGIHSTALDAVSHLNVSPTEDNKENWIAFTKCWCYYTMHVVENTSSSNHKEIALC